MTWIMLHLHPLAKKCTMHTGELGHHWIPASRSIVSQQPTPQGWSGGREQAAPLPTALTSTLQPRWGALQGQGHHPLATLGKLFHL